MRTKTLVAVSLTAVLAAACGSGGSSDQSSGRVISLDFGKRGTDDIVRYYFGGITDPPRDPFHAGLVVRARRTYRLQLDTLTHHSPWAAAQIVAAAGDDGRLDWEEFSKFISGYHDRIRSQPDLATVLAEIADAGDDVMRVDVTGVMSTLRRRVLVRRSDVLDALRSYESNGRRLLYPVGTQFIGQHRDVAGDSVLETTVMVKREDGQWDFFVYDAGGAPADSTLARPRALSVPTQCVGCHFGSKLYEPEKSFPGRAQDGPHGPRRIYVAEALRDPVLVEYFDEHRRRSDHVLGLYATLLTAELHQARSDGTIDADADSVLNSLGF